MADLVSYGNANQDQQALRFRSSFAFTLSLYMVLANAIIALKKGAQLLKYGRKGKPKPFFQRYLRPEKDYYLFLLYTITESGPLDLICKDKVEAEVWIAGPQALISSGRGGRSKIDGWSDGGLYLDDSRDLTSNSPSDSSVSGTRDIGSPEISVSFKSNTSPKSFPPENSPVSERSHVASEPVKYAMMVYIWGEVICDSVVKIGADKNVNYLSPRADVLVPRPLESNVVLDVHHIACGVKHAALGHETSLRVLILQHVENFNSCAVTMAGNFIPGEMVHTMLGFLVMALMSVTGYQREFQAMGDRENISYPREVDSLSGLRTIAVACGVWHTAAVVEVIATQSSASVSSVLFYGQLGNPKSDGKLPCLVDDKLSGNVLKKVACGAYHVAILTSRNEVYTWGKGANGRLGHGDVEDRKHRLWWSETGSNNRKNVIPRLSGENKDRLDKADIRYTSPAVPSTVDWIKQLDSKAAKQGKKAETFSLFAPPSTFVVAIKRM
ncbi:hypothetical protein M0R45_001049 [Rubus argutus]|uniref:Uncharacterized protein n=1 Tax=Rubus argutus TaxID=59490 RepID=A0AAW1VP06_RUBAR